MYTFHTLNFKTELKCIHTAFKTLTALRHDCHLPPHILQKHVRSNIFDHSQQLIRLKIDLKKLIHTHAQTKPVKKSEFMYTPHIPTFKDAAPAHMVSFHPIPCHVIPNPSHVKYIEPSTLLSNTQICREILPDGQILKALGVIDDQALFVGQMQHANEAEAR